MENKTENRIYKISNPKTFEEYFNYIYPYPHGYWKPSKYDNVFRKCYEEAVQLLSEIEPFTIEEIEKVKDEAYDDFSFMPILEDFNYIEASLKYNHMSKTTYDKCMKLMWKIENISNLPYDVQDDLQYLINNVFEDTYKVYLKGGGYGETMVIRFAMENKFFTKEDIMQQFDFTSKEASDILKYLSGSGYLAVAKNDDGVKKYILYKKLFNKKAEKHN